MKYLWIILALVITGCGSPVESVAPTIINFWAVPIHNFDGSHTVTAWMDIEGEGTWSLSLLINGVLFEGDYWVSLPMWRSNNEGRVHRVFEIPTTVATCGDSFIVYGHHGGGDGNYDTVTGELP